MKEVAVELEDVSMHYKKPKQKINSLKQFIVKKIKREIEYEEFIALKNISLQVNKGDVLGLIGLNGAGKSTLLKIIAGVQKPTKGKVIVKGNIAPLLELGAGFDPDLTGRENIYMNGLLLGYDKKFINEHMQSIIEFAEIDEFIESPVKNYSSGMKSRLGFAIATAKTPQVLIVDEVLSVGDGKFKKKSEAKMLDLIQSDTTVLFVSHSIEQVKKICNKVAWLDKGCIKMIGDTEEVCKQYEAYIEN